MWDPIAYYAFGFLDCDPTHTTAAAAAAAATTTNHHHR